MEFIKLNNDIQIPVIGFGVWQIEENIEECVSAALECGYRHIDTAAIYGNEVGVGSAIKKSGIPRKDLFITTKLWTDEMRKNRTCIAYEESLDRLKLDYVDLYLTHWPVANKYIDSYFEMEKLYKQGRIKAIGVSNCLRHHLDDVLGVCNIIPAVNQIQLHPRWTQDDFLNYCKEKTIAVEAYSPLGHGDLIGNETIKKIATIYGKSTAQIIIRWHLQRGVIVLPKSSHPDRIRENINVFDFVINDEHMRIISSLDDNTCYNGHPDTFDW
jgi:methylglyoxal/glyoxal reductase